MEDNDNRVLKACTDPVLSKMFKQEQKIQSGMSNLVQGMFPSPVSSLRVGEVLCGKAWC